MATATKTFKNFIGGDWVPPIGGEYFENRNPADITDSIGRFPLSGAADVDLLLVDPTAPGVTLTQQKTMASDTQYEVAFRDVTVPATVAATTEAPPVPWLGGRYPVSVTTRAGTSDTIMLTIASRGRAP